MKPDWDKLGSQYKGSRTVLIADVDCTVHQSLCGEYGVQGYPTVKYFMKDGPKGGQDYQGGRDFNALKKFVETTLDTLPACSLENMDDCEPWERKILEEGKGMSTADRGAKIREIKDSVEAKKKQAKDLEKEWKQLAKELEVWEESAKKPDTVEQLLTEEDFREVCGSKTCVVGFLPHIYDDQAKGRNENIKILDNARKANKDDGGASLGFFWVQGGDNFELEEKLGLQFGFPAVVAMNLRKEKFAVYRGVWSKDEVARFVKKPSGLAPLPKLPKFEKAKPWDGKDAAPPADEDL
jgi:hypothetical protein